jgi:hypothetical protein
MEEDRSGSIPFEPEKKDEDDREHEVFDFLMKRAYEENKKLWDLKYDKYIKEGLSREDARVQTKENMKSKDLKKFVEKYGHIYIDLIGAPTAQQFD